MYPQNKMKVSFLIIVFSLTAALPGCSGGDGPSDGDFSLQGSYIGMQNTDRPESNRQEERGETPQPIGTEKAPEEISLEELPAYVFQTGDGHLLLLGDTAILMDQDSFETTARGDEGELEYSFKDFMSCKFYTVGEEYLVLGQYQKMEPAGGGGAFMISGSSEMPELRLIRFNRELKVLETLNFSEIAGLIDSYVESYELIDNGTKLLFCSHGGGLCRYDMKTGQRTAYSVASGLKSMRSFGCLLGRNKILFTGSFDDGSGGSYPYTIGTMRPDGSEFQYEKKQTHTWGDVWCFDDFALIKDDETYYPGEKASAFYYGKDGEVKVYPLADEYATIQPSDKGNYFAVQSRTWGADGNSTGYTVRIYASHDGQLLQEIYCPLSEIGQNTMLYGCTVCEDTGKILLLLNDRETGKDARFRVIAAAY